jgi:hypothetical protein
MATASNTASLDRASVLHPFTQLKDFAQGKLGDPTIMETGKGVRITDSTGRESAMAERRLPRRSPVRPISLLTITATLLIRPTSSPSSRADSSRWRPER